MYLKNIKKSLTFKVIMFIIITTFILLGIDISFWAMNQPSTIAFIFGIIIIILVIGLPIEYFIYKFKNKK
jgi:uncharacterized membrane protein